MKMFQDIADEIFEKADVSKKENIGVWNECVEILRTKMASLSTMGLTKERAELFKKQEETLVEDLILLKKTGKLH